MDKEIIDDLARALAGPINKPVTAFLEVRLEELKKELMVCNENVFRIKQGRALEINALLEITTKSRE